MSKKLTASAINSAAKKAYSMKEFHLTDNQGEIWDVDIDVYMNPVHVVDMVQNIISLSAKMSDENISDVFDLEAHWTLLYFIEILKHYTSLDIKEKESAEKTLTAYATLFNSLGSLDLLDAIRECFDKERWELILNKFRYTLAEMSEFISEETQRYIAENNIGLEAEKVAE